MNLTRATAVCLLALGACGKADTRTEGPGDDLDLTALLASGQARAGISADEKAFWGGASAEGRPGDLKIYNSRVRFAIQSPRDGSYYVPEGGHVIDADIVRPPGQPGQDMVDEWLPMAGLGRMIDPHTVTVVDDGAKSGVAVVRAHGGEAPLQLLEGAVEAHGDLIADLHLEIEHTYKLEADSWLMEVTTEVRTTDTRAVFNPGDAILGAMDTADWWGPGRGYEGADATPRGWSGYLGKQNELAFGLFSGSSEPLGTAGVQALQALMDVAAGFADTPVTLEPGESTSWTRYYGVGPDFATLTDEWLARTGQPTDTVSGTAMNAAGPVAGARVSVLVAGEPFTMAISGADGSWSADVPAGSSTHTVVDGRGTALFFDLPPGAGLHGPYAAPTARAATLRSLSEGAPSIPMAQGLGVAEGEAMLGRPAVLHVFDASGSPFEVRLNRLDPEPAVDSRVVRDRPSWHAAGWTADGDLELEVEPASYEVIVHRGARYERYVGQVDLVPGITQNLPVFLPQAVDHPEWIFGDPHVHASPSPDGQVAMDHRMLNMAGTGVQLHFGTDHDHVVDYSVLLAPLGLQDVLNTVLATEMSPVLRGHLNLYPLNTRGDLPNGGGWPWWRNPVQNTDEELAALRERHGGALTPDSGFVVQANHPDSGLLSFGGWDVGSIANPDFYTTDFNAIEVLNGGHAGDTKKTMYFDLVNRGYEVTPTGVSDSHSLFGGGPGLNGTYIGIGTDDPAEYEPNALREAFLEHRTIVSRGLFLELSLTPGRVVSGHATLVATASGPSWAQPDRLQLYRDGQLVETVEGEFAVFLLDPAEDASYVVMAEGDTSMAPVYNTTPWAMSAAVKIDVDGDGWTPPLPPYDLGD